MSGRRKRCPDCAEGFLQGNGRCGQCNGTGINTQIDSDQPKCPYCHGTGVCVTCGGSGVGDGTDDPGRIQTLFNS